MGSGGFSAPSGPPPGADPEYVQIGYSSQAHFSTRVWNMFQAVDRGGDSHGRGNGQIDANELREHGPCIS